MTKQQSYFTINPPSQWKGLKIISEEEHAKSDVYRWVFGLACRIDGHGKLRIMANVRTDQERQKRLAGLPEDSKVEIIDIPGGGADFSDFRRSSDPFGALCREISEECHCKIKSLGKFQGPFVAITNTERSMHPVGDMAFWMPIRLCGEPEPSNEASSHPWISLKELEAEDKYRCVGKLGKDGRTGRMIRDAFAFYEKALDGKDVPFEWTKIKGMSGDPVIHCLRSGNPDCAHEYAMVESFEKYGGQCRICQDCGRVETYPAPGELCEFYGMNGHYFVERDGRPGLGL